jgi:hypothetical protein
LLLCGGSSGSSQSLSKHDQAAFAQINRLVTEFIAQERMIAKDTIAGSKITSAADYVRRDGSRITQINETAQQIRLDVGSLNDRAASKLYDPLSEALSQEADDLSLFLKSIKAGGASAIQQAYDRIGADEEHINNVVLQQLPKVQAYAKKLHG